MTQFLQAGFEGIAVAAVYALLALGFVIIYKSTRVLSFAQPALLLFGGYFVSYFATTSRQRWLGIQLPLPFWVALTTGVAFTVLLGLGIERLALRPMVGRPVFAVAILTIGLDVAIRTVVDDLIGIDIRAMGDPWGARQLEVGGVVMRHSQLAAVVTAGLVVVGVFMFFRTRTGLALRATSIDQEVALAQGVPVARMFALAWAMAGGMAALAGTFVGTGFAGLSQSSALVALKALPAVVVGGLDSVPGALIGALTIGTAETYTATYQSTYAAFLGSNFSQVVPYAVMFLVLLIRPYGLLGTREVERV